MKTTLLVCDNALLMSEWNWEKNNALGLDPHAISYGSAKKVWWKCAEGHEWEASPNHSSGGRNCPICSENQRRIVRQKSILAKRGSLADNNPVLAEQWDYIKNGSLNPSDVTCNSAKKVWWICSKGHEWQAAINSRNSGAGCPVCSGHKLVVGINDLATVNPALASQWHPTKNGDLTPFDVVAHNESYVWWICDAGHEWKAKISNRSSGTGCPICSNKRVQVGVNDLETTNPKLALEWHPTKNGELKPCDVTAGSNKKVWWQCEKGHEWKTAVSHRLHGEKCPKCQSEYKTSFPEQAIYYYLKQLTVAENRYMIDPRTEIDIFLPELQIGIEYDGIYYHSGDKAKQREIRKQNVLNRLGILLIRVKEVQKTTQAPVTDCVLYSHPGPSDSELAQTIRELLDIINTARKTGFALNIDITRDKSAIYEQFIQLEKANSLAEMNPELAAEWHPDKNGKLLPIHFSVYSNRKVWWLCSEGHEWQAVINSRKNGVGCPFCAGKRAIPGETDLATTHPELAAQWHPIKNGKLTPKDVTAGSNKPVWWECSKGHEWKTAVCYRVSGSNCPTCSGHKVLAGYNDLATVCPELADQWHPTKNGALTPSDVTSGSDKMVWWKCLRGHEWEATISSRKAGCGCPYCAGQKVISGRNDLRTLNPALAAEWHPTKNGDKTPRDVMAGSNKKVWWLGKCGHEWDAVISSRNSGRGCPYCAGQRVLVGFNDLATLNSKLASEWHPTKNGKLSPSMVTPSSNKRVWWLCSKGHEWENSVNSRNAGHQCPYCANQTLLVGYNDLQTTNPALAAEWHPTKNGDKTPRDVMAGSNKKAWWLCKCGYEWEATISSRNQGHGCAMCGVKRRVASRIANKPALSLSSKKTP